jgi:anti-sigma factor (TIGR02949 family)
MGGFGDCTCEHCEQVMQPYLDRELTAEEQAEAEAHIAGCTYCRMRYRFESELRVVVKNACFEEMSPELKAKLAALRLEA